MRNGRGITLRLMGEEGETKRAKSRKEIHLYGWGALERLQEKGTYVIVTQTALTGRG